MNHLNCDSSSTPVDPCGAVRVTHLRKQSRRGRDGAALCCCCCSESALKERDAHSQNIVCCNRAGFGARCGPAPGSQSGTSRFSPHRSAAVQRWTRSPAERSVSDTGVFLTVGTATERASHVPRDALAFGLSFRVSLFFGGDTEEGGTKEEGKMWRTVASRG